MFSQVRFKAQQKKTKQNRFPHIWKITFQSWVQQLSSTAIHHFATVFKLLFRMTKN